MVANARGVAAEGMNIEYNSVFMLAPPYAAGSTNDAAGEEDAVGITAAQAMGRACRGPERVGCVFMLDARWAGKRALLRVLPGDWHVVQSQ